MLTILGQIRAREGKTSKINLKNNLNYYLNIFKDSPSAIQAKYNLPVVPIVVVAELAEDKKKSNKKS